MQQEKEAGSRSPKITLDLKAEKRSSLAGRGPVEPAGEGALTAASPSFFFKIALSDNGRLEFPPPQTD